jgi:hypothetical protein
MTEIETKIAKLKEQNTKLREKIEQTDNPKSTFGIALFKRFQIKYNDTLINYYERSLSSSSTETDSNIPAEQPYVRKKQSPVKSQEPKNSPQITDIIKGYIENSDNREERKKMLQQLRSSPTLKQQDGEKIIKEVYRSDFNEKDKKDLITCLAAVGQGRRNVLQRFFNLGANEQKLKKTYAKLYDEYHQTQSQTQLIATDSNSDTSIDSSNASKASTKKASSSTNSPATPRSEEGISYQQPPLEKEEVTTTAASTKTTQEEQKETLDPDSLNDATNRTNRLRQALKQERLRREKNFEAQTLPTADSTTKRQEVPGFDPRSLEDATEQLEQMLNQANEERLQREIQKRLDQQIRESMTKVTQAEKNPHLQSGTRPSRSTSSEQLSRFDDPQDNSKNSQEKHGNDKKTQEKLLRALIKEEGFFTNAVKTHDDVYKDPTNDKMLTGLIAEKKKELEREEKGLNKELFNKKLWRNVYKLYKNVLSNQNYKNSGDTEYRQEIRLDDPSGAQERETYNVIIYISNDESRSNLTMRKNSGYSTTNVPNNKEKNKNSGLSLTDVRNKKDIAEEGYNKTKGSVDLLTSQIKDLQRFQKLQDVILSGKQRAPQEPVIIELGPPLNSCLKVPNQQKSPSKKTGRIVSFAAKVQNSNKDNGVTTR